MTETKPNVSGNFFWLRLIFAGAIVKGIIAGVTAVFSEWTDKPDWVLEDRYWIIAGTYLGAAAIAVGFMFLTGAIIAAVDRDEARRRGETKP